MSHAGERSASRALPHDSRHAAPRHARGDARLAVRRRGGEAHSVQDPDSTEGQAKNSSSELTVPTATIWSGWGLPTASDLDGVAITYYHSTEPSLRTRTYVARRATATVQRSTQTIALTPETTSPRTSQVYVVCCRFCTRIATCYHRSSSRGPLKSYQDYRMLPCIIVRRYCCSCASRSSRVTRPRLMPYAKTTL